MGRFEHITDKPAHGWYEPEGGQWNLEKGEVDVNEWIGAVQWMDVPFSTSGDSGSLVFAREDGIYIPLGIHLGAREARRQSYFLSLETFCYEAENEGLGTSAHRPCFDLSVYHLIANPIACASFPRLTHLSCR